MVINAARPRAADLQPYALRIKWQASIFTGQKKLRSFESTLAEARESSLLAIVVDISDHEWLEHIKITLELLEKLDAGDIPRFLVFNKADRLAENPSHELLLEVAEGSPFLLVSSHDVESVNALREALLASVKSDHLEVSLMVLYGASEALNVIYSRCRVLRSEAAEEGLRMRIQGSSIVVQGLLEQHQEVV